MEQQASCDRPGPAGGGSIVHSSSHRKGAPHHLANIYTCTHEVAPALVALPCHRSRTACVSLVASCRVQEYYTSEWNAEEQAEGKHLVVMKFANESKSQRGMKRLAQDRQAAHPRGADAA